MKTLQLLQRAAIQSLGDDRIRSLELRRRHETQSSSSERAQVHVRAQDGGRLLRDDGILLRCRQHAQRLGKNRSGLALLAHLQVQLVHVQLCRHEGQQTIQRSTLSFAFGNSSRSALCVGVR